MDQDLDLGTGSQKQCGVYFEFYIHAVCSPHTSVLFLIYHIVCTLILWDLIFAIFADCNPSAKVYTCKI